MHHRKQRRRRHMRNFVLAASAFLAAHHGKPAKPRVTTSVSYSAHERSAAYYNVDVTVRPDPMVFEPIIQEAAAKHGVDPALIRAVMRFESAFRPLAVSPVGASGLMQLMPSLAKEFGVRDIFDPYENIMAGTAYLAKLLDRHRGKVDLALASYNAGPGAVARYRGIPPYPETRRYVQKITGFMAKTRAGSEKRGD
jgi:soluble lytic murein transglycosylase-like protein